MPILNAPHQCASVTIEMKKIKLLLTYRYLFARNALRIVTHQNQEYLIRFRSYKHKEKVFKILLKYATEFLDPFYQQLECATEIHQSDSAQ